MRFENLDEFELFGPQLATHRQTRLDNPFKYNKGDPRTVYDTDRDKLYYSSAFRRLGHVCQVVPATDGHLLHNRLTHSLKVSQVGYDIARRLLMLAEAEAEKKAKTGQEPAIDIFRRFGGLNPTVVAAGALAHDIGHPPFGHAGERALQAALYDQSGDGDGQIDSFEGNAQSLRNLMRFSHTADGDIGMNLSYATLNAMQKYPWQYKNAPKGLREPNIRKFGVYNDVKCDLRIHTEARSYLTIGNRRCIEAQVIDMADDIAFAVHDMEDFLRTNLIPALDHIDKHAVIVEAQGILANQKANEDWLLGTTDSMDLSQDAVCIEEGWQALRYHFPNFAGGRYSGSGTERSAVRNLSRGLTSHLLSKVKACPNFGADLTNDGVCTLAVLRAVMRVCVVDSPAMSQSQIGQMNVVKTIFHVWEESLGTSTRSVNILPIRMIGYAKATMHADDWGPLAKMRLITDCVAQLTDLEADETYGELVGSRRRPLYVGTPL